MQPKKRPSLQDINRRRQGDAFVGRDEQLTIFRENLGLDLEDERRRFIFAVSGQGGVGKTSILRRFRRLIEETGGVCALVDEAETEVTVAMARIAIQFREQGHPLDRFEKRYREYLQLKQRLEADPDAPQGFSMLLGQSLAKGGLKLARHSIPGAALALDLLDEEGLAKQAGEWAGFIRRKIGNKDEVQLVQAPVEALTPLLIADIEDIADTHLIGLFFDTYERTSVTLEAWLLDLFAARFGLLPLNIVLTLAGREPLDVNQWSPVAGLLTRLPLEPFSEEEARAYLERKGITDLRVTEAILRLSGGLPLLVAMLAEESPTDPSKIDDPTDTAVDRFLKWVEDPLQRQLAIDAALPRTFNRDILRVLVGDDKFDALFHWLTMMPFIVERADGWSYHQVVRSHLLRYKRRESPQRWSDLHARLAEHYQGAYGRLGLDPDEAGYDETWQALRLEEVYHRLGADLAKARLLASTVFLHEWTTQRSFAKRCAQLAEAAGHDYDLVSLREIGHQLSPSADLYDQARWNELFDLFQMLSDTMGLPETSLAIAFAWRGAMSRHMKHYTAAAADFTKAIEFDSNYAWAYGSRGRAYRHLERYDEAIADFSKAIELDPSSSWFYSYRGQTYHQLERTEEAITDLTKALECEPSDAWIVALRGDIFYDVERYDEALVDFSKAIQLDPVYSWAYRNRGRTYRRLGRHVDALADFTKAVELDPTDVWAYSSRGRTNRRMGHYEAALADLTTAITLDPTFAWPLALRGDTYRLMGRYEEALADLSKAVELDPAYSWAYSTQADIYRLMRRYEEALAAYTKAIESSHHHDWYLFLRSVVYTLLGQHAEAAADVVAAIAEAQREQERHPQNMRNLFNLAFYYVVADEHSTAQHWYEEAIRRGAGQGFVQDAIGDLDLFLTYRPTHEQAIALRDFLQAHLHR